MARKPPFVMFQNQPNQPGKSEQQARPKQARPAPHGQAQPKNAQVGLNRQQATEDDEKVRVANLPHENEVRRLGNAFYIQAALFVAVAIGLLGLGWDDFSRPASRKGAIVAFVISGLAVLVASAFAFLGWGVRSLRPWSQTGAMYVVALTFRRAAPKYLNMLRRSEWLFTPTYARIVKLTPHVRKNSKRDPADILAFIAVLLFIGGGCVAFYMLAFG